MDTGLINGTNMWEGAGAYFETTFVEGTSYRIRVVNSAIDTFFKFSIDNHTLTVITTDFVPIVPFTVDELSIAIGQSHLLLWIWSISLICLPFLAPPRSNILRGHIPVSSSC